MRSQIVITVDGQPMQFLGPKTWDEVKPIAYRQWVRSLKQEGGEFALLQLWYNMRYVHMRWLDEEQRLALLEVLTFTQDRPDRWMIPTIGSLRTLKTYHGPGDKLGHLTFGEFMTAEAARTADNRGLLAATLYTHEGTDRTFNLKRIGALEPRMARQDDDLLEGILINYLGCLDYLAGQYKHVFRSGGSGDAEPTTWVQIGLNLARQTNALGKFSDLEQTNLYLVLPVLEGILKEQAELEKKMKQHGQ